MNPRQPAPRVVGGTAVESTQTVLQIEDLQTHFFTPVGVVRAVDGVSYALKSGETLGVVGESGCGKSVSALSILRLVANPPGRIVGGADPLRGPQPARAQRARDGAHPRQRHLDDLPGADDLAQPALHVRQADRRGGRPAPGPAQARRLGPRRRDAAPRLHPRARAAGARLSAPALRRHAPARHDRHGAVVQSQGADRRRADHGARRHHPGADPRPDARAAGQATAPPSS